MKKNAFNITKTFLNQVFIIKKTWKFSKTFFICKSLIAFLNGLLPVANVWLSKLLIEKLMEQSWQSAFYVILTIALTNFVKGQIVILLNRKIGVIGDLYRNALLFDIQAKIVNMDYAVLFSPNTLKTKELATQSVQGNAATAFLDNTFAMISSTITIISLGVILSSISKWVYLIIAVLTFLKITTVVVDKRAKYRNKLELTDINREISYYMNMLIDENYANDMRMYSISEWVIKKYKKVVDKAQNKAQQLLNKMAINGSIRNVLNVIESFVYYVFLSIRVIFYGLSFADFTLAFTSLNTFSSQIAGIANNIINLAESTIYIEAYRNLMNIQNTIAIEGKGISADKLSKSYHRFTLKNVTFSYPGCNKPVLSDVNISLEENKFYVIVGENGAGKSTLCKLLCRLYDVTSGEILFNGTNIKEINYKSYRNEIGIVFQDYKYYALSIAENVAMNEYDNTDQIRKRIYEALCVAGLKSKIDSLENGIDTKLGKIFDEKGILLSGGELQKMALARVIFKQQQIVILDEPSSALDAFAEDELIQTFNSALKGKTVLYISHRLSVAKYADNVIFLHNNKIEAMGTHEELMANCDNYSEMYNAQAKHYAK